MPSSQRISLIAAGAGVCVLGATAAVAYYISCKKEGYGGYFLWPRAAEDAQGEEARSKPATCGAAQPIQVTAVNGHGPIEVRTSLDATAAQPGEESASSTRSDAQPACNPPAAACDDYAAAAPASSSAPAEQGPATPAARPPQQQAAALATAAAAAAVARATAAPAPLAPPPVPPPLIINSRISSSFAPPSSTGSHGSPSSSNASPSKESPSRVAQLEELALARSRLRPMARISDGGELEGAGSAATTTPPPSPAFPMPQLRRINSAKVKPQLETQDCSSALVASLRLHYPPDAEEQAQVRACVPTLGWGGQACGVVGGRSCMGLRGFLPALVARWVVRVGEGVSRRLRGGGVRPCDDHSLRAFTHHSWLGHLHVVRALGATTLCPRPLTRMPSY